MPVEEIKVGWCNPDPPPIPDQLYQGMEFRPTDVPKSSCLNFFLINFKTCIDMHFVGTSAGLNSTP